MSSAASRPSDPDAVSPPVLPPVRSIPRFAIKGLGPVSSNAERIPTLIIPAPSPKGLAISLTLHGALLLIMGLWYFAVPVRPSIQFEGKLDGSDNGVPEGFTLTGELNTPRAMPEAPIEVSDPIPDTLQMPELPAPEAKVSLKAARKPSAGGAVANANPGAGDGDGFGLARFGEGGETIRGVNVKVGDPQFTLLWNNDADLDLHVIEPGGKEIFWEEPTGRKGGELDVDNTRGYGPENIYWLVDSEGPGSEKVKGPGPPGIYKWFVVYWGGFGGIPKPTHWKVRVKHNGVVTIFDGKFRSLNERSKTYTLKVDPVPTKTALPQPSLHQ